MKNQILILLALWVLVSGCNCYRSTLNQESVSDVHYSAHTEKAGAHDSREESNYEIVHIPGIVMPAKAEIAQFNNTVMAYTTELEPENEDLGFISRREFYGRINRGSLEDIALLVLKKIKCQDDWFAYAKTPEGTQTFANSHQVAICSKPEIDDFVEGDKVDCLATLSDEATRSVFKIVDGNLISQAVYNSKNELIYVRCDPADRRKKE